MIQFTLIFISLVIYLVFYFENKRRIAERFKEITPIPSYPIIGIAYLICPGFSSNFFNLMVDVARKYGDKILFEFEFKIHFVFSDPTYLQVSCGITMFFFYHSVAFILFSNQKRQY